MKLTKSYDNMIRRRIVNDKKFAVALFKDSLAAIFEGDFTYGLTRLHDIVKVGMGFAALSEAVGMSTQNLHRTLSVRGNPTVKTLNKIVSAIAASLGINLQAAA